MLLAFVALLGVTPVLAIALRPQSHPFRFPGLKFCVQDTKKHQTWHYIGSVGGRRIAKPGPCPKH